MAGLDGVPGSITNVTLSKSIVLASHDLPAMVSALNDLS